MKRLRNSLVCKLIILLLAIGFLPNVQPIRARAAEQAPSLTVTLSNGGVLAADGKPHRITVTVTAQGQAVAGAAVYVNNEATGMTDAKGKKVLSITESGRRWVSVRVAAPGGLEKTVHVAALGPGDGAIDLRAVDRAGKPLAGRANIVMDIDWTIPEEGALLILPQGTQRGYFHAWDPTGDRLLLEGTFTVKAGTRSSVTLRGDDRKLVPLAIKSAGTSGYIEINRADAPYQYPSSFAAPWDGKATRVWLTPGTWDIAHEYQAPIVDYVIGKPRDQYLLTAFAREVGEQGASVELKAENLAKVIPTLAPGMWAKDFRFSLSMSHKSYWPCYFDGGSPLFVSAGTYPGSDISFSQDDRYYSWRTDSFGADGPVTFAPGKVYPITVGGTLRASIQMERFSPPDAEVRGTAILGNEHGIALVSGSKLAVTAVGPDGEELPVTVGWDHSFSFVPTVVGRYTVTATHTDAGPRVGAAYSSATAYLDVVEPKFTVTGGFAGLRTGSRYRIEGALAGGVKASAMEMTLSSDWSGDIFVAPVGADGRYTFSGALAEPLPESTGVQVRVRIKGDPASEIRYTGLVDVAPPVIMTADPKVVDLRLAISGTVSDNWRGSIAGARVEYTADLKGGTGWKAGTVELLDMPEVAPLEAETFTVWSALPLGADAYRVRLQLIDTAGNESDWYDLEVDMPESTATLTLWPEKRSFYIDTENKVTVTVLQDGLPVGGLTVRVADEQNRVLGEAATNAEGTARLTVIPRDVHFINVSLLAGKTVIKTGTVFTLPKGASVKYDEKTLPPVW
ncbi:MAG: hypothetical protein K0R39_747 [Symbiobacteriaceae bacterium]|jgi:hypothetical protein|nr:hypothetical protein [Symbiobacteriaceae bacterium]